MTRIASGVAVVALVLGLTWVEHAYAGLRLYESMSDVPLVGAEVVLVASTGQTWNLRSGKDGRVAFPRGFSRASEWKMLVCAPDRFPVFFDGSDAWIHTIRVPDGPPGHVTLRERGWDGPIPASCPSPDLVQRFKSYLIPICKQRPAAARGLIAGEKQRST